MEGTGNREKQFLPIYLTKYWQSQLLKSRITALCFSYLGHGSVVFMLAARGDPVAGIAAVGKGENVKLLVSWIWRETNMNVYLLG